MLKTFEGVYRNGTIELVEQPGDIVDETRVLVTILPSQDIQLATHGIDQAQAADLRHRLAPFAEDWDQADMSVYDDYNTAKQQKHAQSSLCRQRTWEQDCPST